MKARRGPAPLPAPVAYSVCMRKLFAALVLSALLFAQETADQNVNARIRSEEAAHSQIMRTLHMLTDRYGPSLAGSPNYEAAAKWAAATLTEWGLKNAHLEPWDFGHPGWLNERAAGYLVAPVQDTLTFEVLGWTPSTNGTVAASRRRSDAAARAAGRGPRRSRRRLPSPRRSRSGPPGKN